MPAFPDHALRRAQTDWFDGNRVLTALMEAVSMATPAIEAFTIRTLTDLCRARGEPAAGQAHVREWLREEAGHARAHVALNRRFIADLGSSPLGLGGLKRVIRLINRHLPTRTRASMVAQLELLTAAVSGWYLDHLASHEIGYPEAKTLYEWHAREELMHAGALVRFVLHGDEPSLLGSVSALGYAGLIAAYLCVAVPWIVHQKSRRNWWRTSVQLARAAAVCARSRNTYRFLARVFASFLPPSSRSR